MTETPFAVAAVPAERRDSMPTFWSGFGRPEPSRT